MPYGKLRHCYMGNRIPPYVRTPFSFSDLYLLVFSSMVCTNVRYSLYHGSISRYEKFIFQPGHITGADEFFLCLDITEAKHGGPKRLGQLDFLIFIN